MFIIDDPFQFLIEIVKISQKKKVFKETIDTDK